MTRTPNDAAVAYYTPGWPAHAFANGIVTYIANLRSALPDAGYRSVVLSGTELRGDPAPDVIQVNDAPSASSLPARMLGALLDRAVPDYARPRAHARRIRWALDQLKQRYPIRLVEIEESYGIARFLVEPTSTPVVVRLHGPWFLNGPAIGVPEDDAFHRRIEAERKAIYAATAVSAPSRDVLEAVERRHGQTLRHAAVIPNPGPTVTADQRWSASTRDPNRILFVGRFDRHKGGDVMIRAFVELATKHPDAELDFVGPDNGLETPNGLVHLERFVREHVPDERIRARLHRHGPQDASRIGTLRQRAGITVVASRYENFPLTVLEALACGSPLVAARTGGIREMVDDGETGLLFEPGQPTELAERISELLHEPARAETLGRRALAEYERRFTPAVVARDMARFYDDVARGR